MSPHDQEGRITRRDFFGAAALVALSPSLASLERLHGVRRVAVGDVVIVEFDDAGGRLRAVTVPKVVKSEREWRSQLSPLAFEITRRAGTERPFSGAYCNLHEKGLFRCVCCDTALFSTTAKFDSGTGWPSFWQPIAKENVLAPF